MPRLTVVPDPGPAGDGELSPDAARAMRELAGAVWLEPRLRELVEMRTAELNGAAENLVRHAREALALGESRQRIAGLSRWRHSQLFTGRERAALELAEAIGLPENRREIAATRARAAAFLEPQEVAQVVFTIVAANAADRLELALSTSADTRTPVHLSTVVPRAPGVGTLS